MCVGEGGGRTQLALMNFHKRQVLCFGERERERSGGGSRHPDCGKNVPCALSVKSLDTDSGEGADTCIPQRTLRSSREHVWGQGGRRGVANGSFSTPTPKPLALLPLNGARSRSLLAISLYPRAPPRICLQRNCMRAALAAWPRAASRGCPARGPQPAHPGARHVTICIRSPPDARPGPRPVIAGRRLVGRWGSGRGSGRWRRWSGTCGGGSSSPPSLQCAPRPLRGSVSRHAATVIRHLVTVIRHAATVIRHLVTVIPHSVTHACTARPCGSRSGCALGASERGPTGAGIRGT